MAAPTKAPGSLLSDGKAVDAVWVVHSPCDCEDEHCYGKTDLAVFISEQTARQEADLRTKRYGGYRDSPDMHIERVKISTKIRGW